MRIGLVDMKTWCPGAESNEKSIKKMQIRISGKEG